MSDHRRSLWALAAIPAAALVAFAWTAPGCGNNTPTGKPRPDGGPLCQNPGTTCATGTQCNNGNCVQSCDSSGNCPAGFYCEGNDPSRNVCVPTALAPCTIDQDCPLPQFCRSSMCVSKELIADGGARGCLLSGVDGCSNEAICFQTPDPNTGQLANLCVGMPACAQDGTCPVGVAGSVCNDEPDGGRLFPGKQRICLFSFCRDGSNCPAAAECFHASKTSDLGGCYFGTPGSPCFSVADCFGGSTTCVGAPAGGWDAGPDAGVGTCQ